MDRGGNPDPDRARPVRRAAPPGTALIAVLAVLAIALTGCGGAGASGGERDRRPSLPRSALAGRIAYSHRADIWVAAADGRHPHRLIRAPGPQDGPSWSPDGSRIAYRDARGGYNNNDEIFVAGADGSRPRNITHSQANEWSPAWSPDGRWIAYYSGELWRMRPDGSGRRRITRVEGEYPSWSPDGRRLAFMSAEPDARGGNPNYDVFVVNRDGSGLRQLTSWPGEDGWPAWSPDGRTIAFASTQYSAEHPRNGLHRNVWTMRPDGSHKRLVAPGLAAAFPSYSPDGHAIMVVGGRSSEAEKLWAVRPDGTGLRRIPLRGTLPDWTAG